EMIFHYRHAFAGDEEMTLFWITFNSHDVLPWIVAVGLTLAGFFTARATAPALLEAWGDANTPDRMQV
ncbi:MAG: branched-chain amino acid ABC transporter permease, partial [Pseudomonadota bacterium]